MSERKTLMGGGGGGDPVDEMKMIRTNNMNLLIDCKRLVQMNRTPVFVWGVWKSVGGFPGPSGSVAGM